MAVLVVQATEVLARLQQFQVQMLLTLAEAEAQDLETLLLLALKELAELAAEEKEKIVTPL
jgi:hypothetical protein